MPNAGDIIFASDFRTGLVAQCQRTSNSAATITSETGYLRMDNIQVYNGLAYEVSVSPLALKGSVVGDVAEARIRVSTSGAATTGSTMLGIVGRNYADLTATTDKGVGPLLYLATADSSTFSVLLTVNRNTAGGSSTGVQLLASAADPAQLFVKCLGVYPADSGVSL